MKNKKGFTLIELLTVIAILAVILLISIPIILGVLDRARKNSFKNQVLLYVEALKQQTGMALMGSGYSELKNVDNSFYAPTNDSDNKLVQVSVANLNKVMDNVALTNDTDKYFYVEYTTTGYNYYIGEGVRKEGEFSTTCDNTCVTKTYNNEEIRLINFKTFTTDQIVRGDTEVSSNTSEPSTPVADTTVPTVRVSVEGTTATLILSDDIGIAAYCITETNNSGSCGFVETSETTITVENMSDGTYYTFAKDTSNNKSDGVEFRVDHLALELGGYKWHKIGEDTNNIYLLLDAFDGNGTEDSNRQITKMAHCGSQNDSTNNCTFNGSYYVYSWDKSLIREYLNKDEEGGFLYTLPTIVKNKLVQQRVCKDPSIYSSDSYSYGGYTKSEIDSISGATCGSGNDSDYTTDYVRLMTPSEYHNLSSFYSTEIIDYPITSINDNGLGKIARVSYIIRLTSNDWLYSTTIGYYWLTGAFSISYDKYNKGFVKFARFLSPSGDISFDDSKYTASIRPVIVLQK